MMVLPFGMNMPSTWSSEAKKKWLCPDKYIPRFERDSRITFLQAVWESHRCYCPPPHGFFDDLIYVREIGTVGPQRGSILSHHRVDFLLCFPLYMRPLGHGLHEDQQCCSRRIGACFDRTTAYDLQLVPGQFVLFLHVKQSVNERSSVSCPAFLFYSTVQLLVVELLPCFCNLAASCDPIPKKAFWEHL